MVHTQTQKRNKYFLEYKSEDLPITIPKIIVAIDEIGPEIAPKKESDNF
jgi:hypothetical protein